MKRGHKRPGRGFSDDMQDETLRAHGFGTLYTNDPGAAVKAVRSNREGGVLGVVGYRGLASAKKDVLRLLKELHAKGCAAVDAATGRRSDGPDANDLLAEFDIQMRHERMGGKKFSQEAGRTGGDKAARNREGKRTPRDKALRIWRDHAISTDAEAIEKINSFGYSMDWGVGALRNQFDPSGRPRGRRSADN